MRLLCSGQDVVEGLVLGGELSQSRIFKLQ